MKKHFFALISRMKYINRWGLMRNTRYENLSEHSFEVAVTAHAIATIKNDVFGGSVNAERAAVLALYHDAPEILTGDLPTPVKYYNRQTKTAYDEVEKTSVNRLLEMLPDSPEVRVTYFIPDERKDGGRYAEKRGTVRTFDSYSRELVFSDGARIAVADLIAVELAGEKRE